MKRFGRHSPSSNPDLGASVGARRRGARIFAHVAVATLGVGALTDSVLADEAHTQHSFCWRGRPKPECHLFMLTETTGGITWPNAAVYLRTDTGVMGNLNRTSAVGGSLSVLASLAPDREIARLGLNGRYRYWLGHDLALDASPGVFIGYQEDPGYSVHLGALLGDWVGLDAGAEASFDANPSWYGGLKLGAYPGLATGVVLTGLVVLAAVIATATLSD